MYVENLKKGLISFCSFCTDHIWYQFRYEYRENEVHEMNIAKMKFIKIKIAKMKFGKMNLQK